MRFTECCFHIESESAVKKSKVIIRVVCINYQELNPQNVIDEEFVLPSYFLFLYQRIKRKLVLLYFNFFNTINSVYTGNVYTGISRTDSCAPFVSYENYLFIPDPEGHRELLYIYNS